MKRLLLAVMLLLFAGALTYGDPARLAMVRSGVVNATSDVTGSLRESVVRAASDVTGSLRKNTPPRRRAVEIPRGHGGEFALRAKINDVSAPMVIDTGATSVVLTYETAKAVGLPLEMLAYDVDVETAGGRTRAARLTLDRLAIGKLVEHAVPALVVPRGQMKTNLLGMSFLDRLESWEVSADKLKLRGYP
jgi:clan AA aspartic protease (TIGR02281 family)